MDTSGPYSGDPDFLSPDAVRFTPVDPAAPPMPQDRSQVELVDLFGPPIHIYTRQDQIADGSLVVVPEGVAREAGFLFPVALTAGAWQDSVAWCEADTDRTGVPQDEAGRLWDVLWMTRHAIRRSVTGVASEVRVDLYRVPLDGGGREPLPTQLLALCGPGDDGEPVITIRLPHED
ncbi:DUF6573 family protein [Streptomyces sp. SM12]|uniref:DUF6573 family protein n=1 Tax=Streptomyces sp. SM12 TaxID=1071602 RepID=UPI001CA56293|nr:DUF6573 family protein [Streptomyces sp. SM12]